MTPDPSPEIAVIGMAGRFPGARDVDEFWRNLVAGTESVTELSDADLAEAGVDRATRRRADYVRAAPLLAGHDRFDARFFGYSPREAALLDPQQRIFLECAWAAMEDAGYDTSTCAGPVGVYAGAAMNTYLLAGGLARLLLPHHADYVLALTANDKDFLSSRVSYKLGLTGPSVTVQTACSTSLVAVHLACQSLLAGECDMALAGGVAVRVPQRAGYLYQPDGPLAPDGHCRAFDARAGGTLFGSGAGVVVLKPLAAAVTDGDQVYAVIKGSAVNNDGSTKVDYTAPGVVGQAEVVAEALAAADVAADTVSYVEAHGTGTALGDPVEIAALTKAFRRTTDRRGFCAVGSVKTNIGHLDAAAGVTGLIKTVLALRHGVLPASLHFDTPNPDIDFPATPFYVNSVTRSWPAGGTPRRAGVSSLGIGGTNAHVVLEEAPPPSPPSPASATPRLLVISARTPAALDVATRNLAGHLAEHPGTDLADVAHTLRTGRRAFPHRRVTVVSDLADAVAALRDPRAPKVRGAHTVPRTRPVAFLFPGGGSRRPPAIADLCAALPVFRRRIEQGIAELGPQAGRDVAGLLFGDGSATADYARPSVQLPVMFLIEDALAELWLSWGVRPSAMLGHSMGEITAARVAGVLGFADALSMVRARARLVERAAPGGMLTVGLAERDVLPLLAGELDVASVNTPTSCVVSGPVAALDAFAERMAERGTRTSRVPVDSAGHCRLFDPIVGEFADHVAGLDLKPPSVPYLANRTGTWITDHEATDPVCWAGQLRGTVRFTEGVRELLRDPDRVLLEVGPGQVLCTLVRAHAGGATDQAVVPSLAGQGRSNVASVLDAAGRLWLAGAELDWAGLTSGERRRRVSLPTYPFEGERHWFAPEKRRFAERVRTVADRARQTVRGTRRSLARKKSPVAMTPTERKVHEIWCEVLGTRRLGIHDNFFEMGGTSLLLTQSVARVNEACRVELTLLDLIESPTVADFAHSVDTVRRSNAHEGA